MRKSPKAKCSIWICLLSSVGSGKCFTVFPQKEKSNIKVVILIGSMVQYECTLGMCIKMSDNVSKL